MCVLVGLILTSVSAPLLGIQSQCCLEQGLRIARDYKAPGLDHRRFDQETLWKAMGPALTAPGIRVSEVGKSVQGRPIRSISWGRGPVPVLLWSQMHGDESTATMALADLVRWFAAPDSDSLRALLNRSFTITMIPMLNPDGAEIFQRHNAMGVDVNRDARRLVTPEARALKGLRDRLNAEIGFNLHDQSAHNRAGEEGSKVAIALLAPAYNEAKSYNATRERARTMAAAIATALEPALPGRLARYDDTFNPRAFGDLMQRWGTSTVLIESGALPDDPEKQKLRALNVAAILTALVQLTPLGEPMRPGPYERLPFNQSVDLDLILQGGQVVTPMGIMPLDLGLRYSDPLRKRGLTLEEVGDLSSAVAFDTLDITGRFVYPDTSMYREVDGKLWLDLGSNVRVDIHRTEDADSPIVLSIFPNAVSNGTPDAE